MKKMMYTMKIAIALCLFILSSVSGFAKEHVTMSLKNIGFTSSTIEFDLFIINDGSTALQLSACSYGVNFNRAILNGGTLKYSYQENSRGTALNGLTSFTLATAHADNFDQLRMTSVPAGIGKAPVLEPNMPFKVGRFKMTNSTNWTPNSNPEFSLQELKTGGLTATVIVAYIDQVNKLTAMTTALTTVTTLVEKSPDLNATQTAIATSNTVNVQSKTTSSNTVGTFENANQVKIYPNPVLNILNAEFMANANHDLNIHITDMHGRLVKQILSHSVEGLNHINFDVSSFTQGVYTLTLSDSGKLIYTQTFTKE